MTSANQPTRLAAALAHGYQIERELGEGGMATVYLAQDLKHRRRVAIKVLKPDLAAAVGADRFLREIEVVASLHHPHILPLYDSGEADGFLYYVMPFVEGESLRDRLNREKQLPLDEALKIAREVADALGYAHNHDVVHRDIKPENILLESGHAEVADFGIARAINAAGGDALTATGIAVGTPAYMSPEQASGTREIDGRSDLYSLGCVLYEMLAGQPPFGGLTAESLVRQHMVVEPQPITNFRPTVPAGIAGLLTRVLAKNPADRFSPAAQFADALDEHQIGPSGYRPEPVGARMRLVGILALVVTLGLISVLWFAFGRNEATIVAGSTTQITLDQGLEIDPAISPDGQMIAYAAGRSTNMQIYVRRISGGRTIALTSDTTRHYRWPRWLADGSQVAFQGDSAIYVAPALGGTPRPLVRLRSDTVFGFDIAPDGSRVAYVLGVPGQVYIQEPPNGEPRAVTLPEFELHSVAWSPDGSRLAYVNGNFAFVFGTIWFGNEARSSIWTVAAAGGDPIRITGEDAQNVSPVWGPDGRSMFWVSNRDGRRDIYRVRLTATGEPANAPQRLSTGLGAHGLSLDRRARQIAYSSFVSHSNVWSIPIPASGFVSISLARQVTSGNQTIEGMDVSHDGEWLVFDSNRGGTFDIYKMPVSGGEIVQLTTHDADDFMPRWSPDRRAIVFHSLRNGNRDIYTIAEDGSNETQRTSGPTEEMDSDWTGDAQGILFGAFSTDDVHLQRMMLTDGSTEDLPYGEYVRGSPSGRRICYTEPTRGLTVYDLVDRDGRLLVGSTRETEGPQYCAWGARDDVVYYLSSGPPRWAIWSIPAVGGAPTLLVDFDDASTQHTRYGFDVEQGRIYVTLGSHESDVWVLALEEH